MMMKEYDLDSLKYWKESAVYSGTIAFLYLLQYIALSMFREALSYTSAVTDSRWFLMSSEISLAFFILFIISGILAVRGRKSGVIMGLISTIIIVSIVMILGILLSGLLFLFSPIFALLSSPPAILSIVNIYYSARAIGAEIHGTLMSLPRFLACSIQYCVAIFMGIVGVFLLFTFFSPILITLSIILFYSAHHMFKNDEEDISKKRVYILTITSIALLILLSFFSVPSLMPSQEAFVRFLVVFGEALIIPFIIASLGFVVAIPRQSHLSRPSAVLPEEFEERYGIPSIPRQEESYSTSPVIKTKTYERGGIYYCRYCGRIVPADSIYCQYCGRKLR